VRRQVDYSLSLRTLAEMTLERGIEGGSFERASLSHQVRAVIRKNGSRCKRTLGRSWRVDETYVKVKGQWKYLYRAVDKEGNTVCFQCEPIVTRWLDFMISGRRSQEWRPREEVQ
jgi:putative transposase